MAKFTLTAEFETADEMRLFIGGGETIDFERVEYERASRTVAKSRKNARKGKKWTQWEDPIIVENYLKKTNPQLAQALSRPVPAVQQRLKYLYNERGLPHRRSLPSRAVVVPKAG